MRALLRNVPAIAVLSVIVLYAGGIEAGPGRATLVGTDGSGGNLLVINIGDGTGTVVGPLGVGSAPSLATDPATGVLYMGSGGGIANLYTVNPATGAATLVGNTGLGSAAIGGMDFGPDGLLYAAVNIAGAGNTGSDHLAIIDKNTGGATLIGPFGDCVDVDPLPVSGNGACTIEGIEGIAFDNSGQLWGSHSTRGVGGDPGLYLIDHLTGMAQFQVPIVDVTGFSPSGGVVSIQFTCSDLILGGGTATALPGAPDDGGFLVVIDPATGDFFPLGNQSATGGSSLAGLAFESPCPRPEICDNGIDDDGDGRVDDLDAEDCEPLAVALEFFTATVEKNGVRLRWKTTSELNNVGFRILRAGAEGNLLRSVISNLLPAHGSELAGAEYEFLDRRTPRRGSPVYYLEDIDLDGKVTRHGPVAVEFGGRGSKTAPAPADVRRWAVGRHGR